MSEANEEYDAEKSKLTIEKYINSLNVYDFMINKALLQIILDGRERRSKDVSDCCEDVVEAARNRPMHLQYPGDEDAPQLKEYKPSNYKV